MISKKHLILSYLFNLRVLTYDQIFSLAFRGLSDCYCHKLINGLCKDGYVEKNGTVKTDSYYSITRKGASFLKKNGIYAIQKIDGENIEFPDYPVTASRSVIAAPYVKHQLSLNQFVIDFRNRFPYTDFSYYDEIFVSSLFRIIRPDGILKVGSTYYFLEMDMNTERKSSLMRKWENYRKFLASGEVGKLEGRICVLFILGGTVKDKSFRADSIARFVGDNLEYSLSPKFNIYADTKDNLLALIKKQMSGPLQEIPSVFSKAGFKVSDGTFEEGRLKDFYFLLHLERKDKDMFFVFDDFSDGNLLVQKNLRQFPKFSAVYKSIYGKFPKYIIMVKNEDDVLRLTQRMGGMIKNVYFTTRERLLVKKFPESLFVLKSTPA